MMLFSCASISPRSAALQVVMGLLSCTRHHNLYTRAEPPSLRQIHHCVSLIGFVLNVPNALRCAKASRPPGE